MKTFCENWHSVQAITLFFFAIKTHKSGYLGTGINVTSIVQEIFGG